MTIFVYYLSFFWLFDHDVTFNRSRTFAILGYAHIYACITHSRSSDFELTNTQTPTHLILWIIDNFNLFRVKNYVNPGSSNTYIDSCFSNSESKSYAVNHLNIINILVSMTFFYLIKIILNLIYIVYGKHLNIICSLEKNLTILCFCTI